MGSTYANLYFHIVFSVKYREPYITPEVETELYPYMREIIRQMRGVASEIGGMPDHIHLLVGWRTDETLANLMRTLKAETSGWLRRRFPDKAHFHWQEGYSVFSVSETHRKNVIEYIKNQKEHHKTQSSLDELRALLKEHGLTSDDPST